LYKGHRDVADTQRIGARHSIMKKLTGRKAIKAVGLTQQVAAAG
jgi:hypothetical protein